MTVTATEQVTPIRWTMGDGATVTCTGPGTPYRCSEGMADSPDCGHRYATTSSGRPGERFVLTGSTPQAGALRWSAKAPADARGESVSDTSNPLRSTAALSAVVADREKAGAGQHILGRRFTTVADSPMPTPR